MKYKVKYHEYQFICAEGEAVNSPNKLHQALKEDFSPISEEMHLLILNIKNKVIDKYLISKGSHNILISTPSDILTPVLKANGRSFALAHNHPSGDTTPSNEDIIFTKRVQKAAELLAINFIDHIIYTPLEYYSFRKEGLI